MKGYKNSTKTVYETESSANYGKVGKVMGEFKSGTLHSGSKKGPVVKSPKQAIAIGLSEARKAGANIPLRKAKESPAKERAEHRQAGGLMGEREAAAKDMVGKRYGGKVGC